MNNSRQGRRVTGTGAILMVVVAALLGGGVPRARAADVEWATWAGETRKILADVIRIDTTNPPGRERAVCDRLKKVLAADGIPCQILERTRGRGNLVARLKATRPTPGNKALLWLAHLDVVGVKGQPWTVPPFEAIEKDGYLYGRGSLDDKGMAVLGVQVMRLLKRTGVPLTRDFVLMLTADEESSAVDGIQWLLAKHPELFDAAFAINENGEVVTEAGQVRTIEIQTGEKTYVDLKLSATGATGHSSLPVPDTAIHRLSRALARLGDHTFPVELGETMRHAATLLARTSSPDAPLFAQLVAPDAEVSSKAAAELSKKAHYNAVLRTTMVATMIEGGTRVNVLPAKVSANVNCRVLPGSDMEAFLETVRKVIDDPLVQIDYDKEELEASAPSPVDNELFRAIERAGRVVFPAALAIPRLSPGASDSRFVRRFGIPCYGLVPYPISRDEMSRLHAADERLPLASFEPGMRMGYQIAVEACGAAK